MDMDVNYLLHRQQMSLILAQTSRSAKGKAAYEDMAREYIDRVEAYRRQNERLVTIAH